MKYLVVVLMLALVAPAVVEAKGSFSGGSSRSFSSSRSVSPSKPSNQISKPVQTPKTPKTPNTPDTPKAPKVSSKPSSSTKTVDAPVKTTASGKKTTGRASVVDDTYKPKIKGGYVPPNGSTVQYVERSASFIDYLPWLYIFSQSHRDNINNKEAVVTEPDGTEKSVVIEEGNDGLLIFNWFIMIVLTCVTIYGVVFLVNTFTKKQYA